MLSVVYAFVLFFFVLGCGDKDRVTEEIQQNIPQNIPKEYISGTNYEAHIFIDKNGLPYVEANSLKDGFFALGYIMAKMRYAQIDLIRLVTNSLVSSLIDVEQAIAVDALTLRTLVNPRTGELVHHLQWDFLQRNAPHAAVLIQAFVDGVNLYIKRLAEGEEELPPEYENPILSLRDPRRRRENLEEIYITPQEVLATARFVGWYLTGEGDLVFSIIKARIKERIAEDAFKLKVFSEVLTSRAGVNIFTLPSPLFSHQLEALKYIYSVVSFHPLFGDVKVGSNNFVLSQRLALRPIVANDPHLAFQNPSIWFPISIRAEGKHLEGFAPTGIPAILSGTNGSVAWVVTNAGYDSLDLYVERVQENPACPSGFSFVHDHRTDSDDSCVKMVEHKIGSKKKPKIKIYFCDVHGVILGKKREVLEGSIPIETHLEAGSEYIAFRWIGQETSLEAVASRNMVEARTVDEFMKAITEFEVAPVNFVFADLKGNIGFGAFSLLPSRNWDLHRFPPTGLLPTDGCCDWRGWIPKDNFPHVKNPQNGFIVTANNDLPGYTADGDPFNDQIYLFWSYDPGYRIAELTYMIQEKAKRTNGGISSKDVKEIMEDTISYWTRMVLPKVLDILRKNREHYSPSEKRALEVLEGWDMTCRSGFSLEDLVELRFSEVQESGERRNSAGCTIWWVFVTRLIWNTFSDELREYFRENMSKLFEDYFMKNLYFYLVENRGSSDFFDIVTTSVKEDVDSIVLSSFKEAVDYLLADFGDDPEDWLWGKLCKVKLYHPMSQAGFTLYDVGPFPVDLGPFAPAVVWINLVTTELKKDFIGLGGPSLRSIAMPEKDRFKISFAFPGGAAGFGYHEGRKTLTKPDPENNFSDLLPTFFGSDYISFEEDKTRYKRVILILR